MIYSSALVLSRIKIVHRRYQGKADLLASRKYISTVVEHELVLVWNGRHGFLLVESSARRTGASAVSWRCGPDRPDSVGMGMHLIFDTFPA